LSKQEYAEYVSVKLSDRVFMMSSRCKFIYWSYLSLSLLSASQWPSVFTELWLKRLSWCFSVAWLRTL